VIGQGVPAEILKAGSERVRQFMEGLPDGPVPFHYPAPDFREQLLSHEEPLDWFRTD